MTRQTLTLGLATVVGLTAAALFAANEARVIGTVVDETGEPVAGMKIKVQDLDKTTILFETKTDTKGRYRIELDEATATYVYQLDKKGFAPFETSFAVDVGKESEMNFTVLSAKAAREGAPAMFNQGAAAAKDGDLTQAEAKFRGALELDPDLAPAHAALARVLLTEQRQDEALLSAEKAVGLEPDNTRYLGLRYQVLRGLGDEKKIAEARAALDEADPQRAAASRFKQGMDLFNEGGTTAAQAAFEATISANPDHPRGHYMLGLCLANQGQNAKAAVHLARFLELTPEDPDAAGAREMLNYLQ